LSWDKSSITGWRRGLMVWVDCVMALLLLKRRGNPTGIFNIEQRRISGFDAGYGVRPVASSSTEYRGSGLVVRPRGRCISTVKVRVGVSHNPVAEGNCAVVRRGEEQPEANSRSAGNELDSAVCNDELSAKWRSLKITDHAIVVGKAMTRLHIVVGGGTNRRYGAVSGETWAVG